MEPFFDSEWDANCLSNLLAGARGSGCRVGIIDSGFNLAHDQFYNSGMKVAVRSFVPEPHFPNVPFHDPNGHGTHCLSTVHRLAPDASFYLAQAVNEHGVGRVEWMNDALEWLKSHDVHVVLLSLGTSAYDHDMYRVMHEMMAKGTVFVCAVANLGEQARFNIAYPARFGNVICVGSHNLQGRVSDFSSAGRELDFLAPGEGIERASPFNQDGMATKSGTSMAAPYVAGLAALLVDFYIGEGISPLPLPLMRHVLTHLATSPGHHENDRGYGVLRPKQYLEEHGLEVLRKLVKKRTESVATKYYGPRLQATLNYVCESPSSQGISFDGVFLFGKYAKEYSSNRFDLGGLTFAPMTSKYVSRFLSSMKEAVGGRKDIAVVIGLNGRTKQEFETLKVNAAGLPLVAIVPFVWSHPQNARKEDSTDQKNMPYGPWRFMTLNSPGARTLLESVKDDGFVHMGDGDIGSGLTIERRPLFEAFGVAFPEDRDVVIGGYSFGFENGVNIPDNLKRHFPNDGVYGEGGLPLEHSIMMYNSLVDNAIREAMSESGVHPYPTEPNLFVRADLFRNAFSVKDSHRMFGPSQVEGVAMLCHLKQYNFGDLSVIYNSALRVVTEHRSNEKGITMSNFDSLPVIEIFSAAAQSHSNVNELSLQLGRELKLERFKCCQVIGGNAAEYNDATYTKKGGFSNAGDVAKAVLSPWWNAEINCAEGTVEGADLDNLDNLGQEEREFISLARSNIENALSHVGALANHFHRTQIKGKVKGKGKGKGKAP